MHLYYYGLFEVVAQARPTTEQVESGFGYVIAAFTAVWLFIAAYLFWLNRRQENLRREVELLRQEEAERQVQAQAHLSQPAPEPAQAVRAGGPMAGIAKENADYNGQL